MKDLTHYTEPTMSSRQIANLVGLRHDNVKRTIKTLKDKELIKFTQIEESGKINGLGLKREVTVYHLNERDSY